MKKLVLAGLLLAGLLGANAQISTTTLTSYGNLAGTLGGNSCTYYGSQAGRYFTGTTAATGSNTFIGQSSGNSITSGNSNTYTGYRSGYGSSSLTPAPGASGYLVTGNGNSFYGASSGVVNNGGNENADVQLFYTVLRGLIESGFAEGAGDLRAPSGPRYTECRLTPAGRQRLIDRETKEASN